MVAVNQLNADTKEQAKHEGGTLRDNGATPALSANTDRPLSPTTTPSPQGSSKEVTLRSN